MEKTEFITAMAVLESGSGKTFKDRAQLDVYFDLLQDLTFEQLRAGVKRALAEHEFATLPSIAMLRRLALETSVSGAWATEWAAVVKGIRNYGHYQKSQAYKTFTERTKTAIEAVGGWDVICECEVSNMGILSGQFRKAWESLEETETRTKNFDGAGIGFSGETKKLASSLKGIE